MTGGAMTKPMDTKKLRLSSDRCCLLDVDGKVIRPLLDGEIAGIGEYASRYGQGYVDDHLEEMICSEEEAARGLAWMERDRKNTENFIAWWKSTSYEERLALVKKHYERSQQTYDELHLHDKRTPAEDVAKIADISSDWFLSGWLAQAEARSRGELVESAEGGSKWI